MQGEPLSPELGVVGALMGLGVRLHLTAGHCHAHLHPALEHTHEHVHDAHHRHPDDFAWHGEEPHPHPRYPDIHHHHAHR